MPTKKSRRGFASWAPAKQRAVASKAGKVAHATGKVHEYTSAEASAAGRKGASSPKRKRGSVLDPVKVRRMRRLHAAGWSYTRLAAHFGVTRTMASRVCKREAWQSVE